LVELTNVSLHPDPSLAEDGFRVDTPNGEVVADLTMQLHEILRRLEVPRGDQPERATDELGTREGSR